MIPYQCDACGKQMFELQFIHDVDGYEICCDCWDKIEKLINKIRAERIKKEK